MEELKQRVRDVVSYNKNIGVVQTKIQVLSEMVAQVQSLRISGGRDDVRKWLTEAGDILTRADAFLEGSNGMAIKKRLCSTCWDPTSSWEIGDILRVIDRILKEQEGLDLPSVTYCKNLQSRENMLEDILEALMDIHVNMIGIHGMFGVGKTVLAEELATRAHYNQLFDRIVLVQVCESLDVKLIQTQIANKIGLQLSEVDDEETRAHILRNKLDDKVMESGQENNIKPIQQREILVILDGIHHVIDLRKVGISHEQEGKSRCKVVVISRNSDVCKEMGAEKNFLLECLNLEEAKILFRERLGDKITSMDVKLESEMYEYVENVMVLKCRGLPWMVNSLACALRSMSNMSWSNWEILADEMEMHTLLEVDEVKEVPSAILELCNNFIQTERKQKLFLLCCLLILEGEDVPLQKLMRYGIGFDLFDVGSFDSAVGHLNSWVLELKSLSLLMESEKPQRVKMHVLVQDIVISALSQGYVLPVLLDAGNCWHTRESYENCIGISMTHASNYKFLSDLDLHKLEAFLLKGRSSLSLPNHLFQGMQNLKILDISGITFVDFPTTIGDLKNLVTLHLEHCDIKCRVISTISNLAKLEVLSLRGSSVETVPAEIGNLTNLRLLDLTRCKDITTFCVDAVAKLDQLRGLYLYDICWDWSTNDVKKLNSLPLEVLEIVIPKTCQVSLNVLNLRSFMICMGRLSDTPEMDFSYFSRVLIINGEVSYHFQESGLRDLFPLTECLQIKQVSGLWNDDLGDLSIHGFMHLRNLYVERCDGMKCIFDARKQSLIQRDIFPELKILTLTNLSSLTRICHWQAPHSSFSKLRELRLKDLNQLQPYVLPVQVLVKLMVMEVINCGSLCYIFPISEISVELPCMKKLELKGLWNLQALQDVLEDSVTNDELQRPRHLLFSEKIKFPSLEEMHLEDLNKIENLFDFSGSEEHDVELSQLQTQTWGKQPYGRSPCFGNLKCMRVSHCNKLKSLFPSSIVRSLLQLETLQVNGCDNMEEVITSTEVGDESNPTTTISFPKLHTLELRLLNTLQCFYKGHLLIKFPKLRELNLDNLKKLKGFTLPNTQSLQTHGTILFDGEIDFPSLEHLGVSWMNIESLQRHGETTIFPNLSRLALKGLPNLKALPNFNPNSLRFLDLNKIECSKVLFSTRREYLCFMSPSLSWELEELTLAESGSLEELVDVENSVDSDQLDVKLLVSLKKLDLCRLHHLKRIPWNMLRNLRSLIIYTLKGWTSLISTTLLVGGAVLPLLEHIEVVMCDSLEAIISQEPQEDEDLVKYGMTLLPCLRHIELYWLPKLQIFSMGSYEAHFPSLETVVIWDCHYLQLFSMGLIRTPRLKYVKLDSTTTEADTFLDLNALVAAVAEEKKMGRAAEAQEKREDVEEAEARLAAAEAKVRRSTKTARITKVQRASKAEGLGLGAKQVDWGAFDLQELENVDEEELQSLWVTEDEIWGAEALASRS